MPRLKSRTKNTLFTLLLTTLAACHGSCDRITASQRASEPGAACYVNDATAVCVSRDTLYACDTTGAFSFDATCSRIGTVTYTQPAEAIRNVR